MQVLVLPRPQFVVISGKKLRVVREDKRMSQEELADKVEYSREHIGRIEHKEKHKLFEAQFKKFLVALNAQPEQLLYAPGGNGTATVDHKASSRTVSRDR